MKLEERKALTRKYIQSWQTDNDVHARNEAVMLNTGLVVSYVETLQKHWYVDHMDDIQEGYRGLIRACDLFDLNKGFAFSSYAIWWIRSYIQQNRLRNHAPCRPSTEKIKQGIQTPMTLSMDYEYANGDDGLYDNFGSYVPDESIFADADWLCDIEKTQKKLNKSGHEWVCWNSQTKSWKVVIHGKYIKQFKKLDKAVGYRDSYLSQAMVVC